MTTMTNGAVLADQLRQIIANARQVGEQPPGRPTLAKLTGATDYAIRKALEELETPAGEAGDDRSPTGDQPAVEQSAEAVDDTAADGPLADAVASVGEAGDALATAVTRPSARGGKAFALAGFLFGSVVSVAANVLAVRVAPEHAPKGWAPGLDAQIGAAVWPLGLLISVEVLSRVPWPRGVLWSLARFGGVGIVALGSAVISYGHIRSILASWGYDTLGAGVGPLVVDGLMTICGFALLATAGDSAGDAGETVGE